MLKILFIGDVCGNPGRKAIAQILPNVKKQHNIDFVVANAENAAGGRGVTRKIVNELCSYGVDLCTSGVHVWRQDDFLDDLNDPNLPIIRPANYPEDIPYGRGYEIVDLGGRGRIAVINLLGHVFMRELVLDPLRYADTILEKLQNEGMEGIFIDFHAETTSEKGILARYLDGRVTAIIGTHTHVPTADTRVLPKGSGFVTDVGMTGPVDSVLWVQKEIVIHNYLYPYKKAFKIQKHGPLMFNSVIVEVEKGMCKSIRRVDVEIPQA